MSSTSSTRQGYDAVFLSEVPEDLTCAICHLVLRNPVQIIACGHRYCAMCFEDITLHNKQANIELVCPVDRKPVDLSRVFEDNGMTRMVRNLGVKCRNHNQGCEWNGCLGDLGSHVVSCDFNVKDKSPMQDKELMEMKMMYQDVLRRLGKCEEDILTKEKEIGYLKLHVKDIKEKYDENKTEVRLLKVSTAKLLHDVESLQGRNEEITRECTAQLQEFERKNSTMEKEIQYYKTEFKLMLENNLSKESTDDVKVIIDDQIDTLKTSTDEQICILKKKIEEKDMQSLLADVTTNIENLKSEISKVQKETTSIRSHLDKSLNTKTADIEDIIEQVKTTQNSIFLFDSIKSKNVQYTWICENFKHHYDEFVDESSIICSPVFYSQVMGYRFHITIDFKDQNKNMLGIFIFLHRGRDNHGLIKRLPPFEYEYSLEILGKNNARQVYRVSAKEIKEKSSGLLIADGEDESKLGFGQLMLTYPYDDYIFNDSLHITFTVHL